MLERLVICGGEVQAKGDSALNLSLDGRAQNITLKLEDISKRLVANVPDLLIDLVEIATYIYCADQATSRGGEVQAGMGSDWRRKFRFVIPVRRPDHWSHPKVLGPLCDAVSFLSEDDYEFEFEKATNPTELANYLELSEDSGRFKVDEVVLFSGDSIRSAARSKSFRTGQRTLRSSAIAHRPRYLNIRGSLLTSSSDDSPNDLCTCQFLSPDGSRSRSRNILRDRDPFSTRRLLARSPSCSQTARFVFSKMASSASTCLLLNKLWVLAQRALLIRWCLSFFVDFSAQRSALGSKSTTRLCGRPKRRLSDQLSITAADPSSSTP